MKTYKKTIILSDKKNKKRVMTLDLENKNNMIFGYVKAYGSAYPTSLLLGIKEGVNIHKQNIKLIDNKCQFKLTNNINLDDNIDCAMVDVSEDKFEPILWGSSRSKEAQTNILSSLKKSASKLKTMSSQNTKASTKPQSINDNSNQSLHSANGDTLDNYYIKNLQKTTHTSSQYDDSFSPSNIANNKEEEKLLSQISLEPEDILDSSNSNQSRERESNIAMASSMVARPELFETNEKELNEIIDENIKPDHEFYNMIADQIDELFARYPREKNLETLIDNSMWCKIDTDTDNKYYVVGIIKENNDIKYICYGVPGNYNIEPPLELKDYSQWLPTDPSAPYDNGYWVMYQDSTTGENVLLK